MKLLTSLAFPWNYVAGAAAILGLVAAIIFGAVQCKQIDRDNTKAVQQTGVVLEREQTHEKVIKNVEDAHQAVTNPTPAERDVVCGKYDRNCPSKVGK